MQQQSQKKSGTCQSVWLLDLFADFFNLVFDLVFDLCLPDRRFLGIRGCPWEKSKRPTKAQQTNKVEHEINNQKKDTLLRFSDVFLPSRDFFLCGAVDLTSEYPGSTACSLPCSKT